MENEMYKDNFTGKFEGDPEANWNVKYLTASSVIGDKVLNNENENMGVIHDIMLNVRDGKIQYYVIEFGGFLGIGEKFFAIPFHLLQLDPEHKVFRFNEKRETLKKAPGFDKNHWPQTNEHKQQYVEMSWGFWDNPDEEEF